MRLWALGRIEHEGRASHSHVVNLGWGQKRWIAGGKRIYTATRISIKHGALSIKQATSILRIDESIPEHAR